MLMGAIHRGHLYCSTIGFEKRNPDTANCLEPQFFLRYHLDAIDDCMVGRKFDRKLLNWALVERWAIQQWCERRAIPLPDFWFPRGWNVEYEVPQGDEDDDIPDGVAAVVESPQAGK